MPWTHLSGGRRDDRGRSLVWAAPNRSGAVTTAPKQLHRVSRSAAAPFVLIRPDHASAHSPRPRPRP